MLVLATASLLTACGGTGIGASPTPARSASPAGTLVVCGVTTARGGTLVISGGDALKCFVGALARCAPATLQLRDLGVDAGTDHAFTVLGGDPCRVRDQHAHFVAPHTPSPLLSDVCSGTAASGSSVALLACGTEGDVALPAPS